jgi:DNA helicase MCM8
LSIILVIRASSIKPLVIQMAFDCTKCKGSQVVHFLDGKYNYPTKCSTKGCGAKSFEPNRTSYQTITVDSQSLKIQENTNDNSNDLGRVPRTVDCEVSNSLVDRVTPGDMVACTGLVKANQASGGKFAQKSANTIYTVYLDLVNISKASGSKEGDDDSGNRDADQNSKESIKFSDKDLKFVNALYSEPNLFKLIVNSFCPKIFGHELVKAGVLLSLFGGRRRNTLKKGDISIRGDSHVLIVGDPGLGKSQILMAAKNLAPRGVYVCGTSGVSSSGLTVTLSKEAGSNDFALEAGALVLGDQGICCIDEFDKMTHEHSSLLEAMEQQSISIAKGGIVCTLPARTSIVAAANPTGGHYNKAKTVSENLKMNSALLSRFDLVFILLDKPNQVRDHYLSKHIMQMHSGRTFDQPDPNRIVNEEVPEFESSGSDLYLRLHRKPGEKMDLVPGQMLRKYIAYAKAHCHPYLSPKAGIVLKEFYLELRKKHQSIDSTPITTRQLESLIRLAEARAKMELRETVTEADAQDVVELLKHSLFDTYEDEVGNLDFSRSQNGTGMSKRETVKR